MTGQVGYKRVRWILFAVVALSPASFFAQQEKDKPESAQAKTAQVQVQTDDAQVKAAASPAKTEKDDKVISGMSILGNQDAPKSLVIVPWKSSEIGDTVGISTMLDDSRLPIDKEVFMRMLSYYEIRSGTARASAVPVQGNAAQPVAAQRRK
jgi:uncharacterized protein YpmB